VAHHSFYFTVEAVPPQCDLTIYEHVHRIQPLVRRPGSLTGLGPSS